MLSCFSYDWNFTPLKRRDLNIHEEMSPKPPRLSKGKERKETVIEDSVCTEEDKEEFVYPSHL